jgi:uncharacterized protein (DUF58 family)
MTRYRVLLLLFAIALGGAINSNRGLWWGFAGALLAMIVIAVLWAWTGVNWLRLARRTPQRVAQAGQMLEEEFKLSNLSRVPKLWVEVRDLSTLPGHHASRVLALVGGLRWRGWKTKTRCLLRGRYELGPVEVRSGDPLGIYQMHRRIDIVTPLLVHPATFSFRDFPMPPSFVPGGDAQRRRTHHVTPNAAGVRDYVAGDSINRVHWPSTARRQKMIVKEFELDPVSDVWIALDLSRQAQAGEFDAEAWASATLDDNAPFRLPATTEEYAVSMAASAAKHFVNEDRTVGFIAHGAHRQVLTAERGTRQIGRILEVLSVLRADGELPFDRVLSAECIQLARGATLIAVSSSLDPAWVDTIRGLARNGVRAAIVFVDPLSFDAQAGSREDRDDVLSALAQSGVGFRVVGAGELPI